MSDTKRPSVDELIERVMSALPNDVQQVKTDFEQQLRQAMTTAFSRMDLVTREEFDVQAALLARTRERLEELLERLEELESQQAGVESSATDQDNNLS